MRITIVSMALAALLLAVPGGASALTLDGIQGSWQNLTGGDNAKTFDRYTGLGNNQESRIMWGVSPYSASMQSGLGFTGSALSQVEYDSVFQLGTLRYINRPTLGESSPTSVQLALSFFLEQQEYSYLVDFNINETLNVWNGGAANNDTVTITSVLGSDPFGLNLDILGFGYSPDNLLSDFSAPEFWSGYINMYAAITPGNLELPIPNPEPATMVLASLGLGAMAWARRRKS